jgi:putative salt-induced outer membrane protein YdiY
LRRCLHYPWRAAFATRVGLLVCLLIILAVPTASADEVRLLNGDRITGRVVSLVNGLLLLQTPNGDLRVPWPTVAALMVVEPIYVTVGTRPPVAVTIWPDGTSSGRVGFEPGGVVPVQDILSMSRPPPPRFSFDGRLNAGIVASGGNSDANTVRFAGDLVARSVANRITAGATMNRSQEQNVATARNWSTSLRYDRFFTQRFFVNGNTILSSDRLRDLSLRSAVGTGLGYQVLDLRRLKITTDAGLGYVKELSVVGTDDRYVAAQESAKVDVFVDASRFQLFHRHDGYFGLAGNDNRFVKTQNGVRVSIVRGIIATAQLDVDYDPSPVVGRQSFDRTFALNFGYQF